MTEDKIELNYCFDRQSKHKLKSFYEEMVPTMHDQNDFCDNRTEQEINHETSSSLCEGVFAAAKR
jgi:hypothetical protein